jgi:hypothetical protein
VIKFLKLLAPIFAKASIGDWIGVLSGTLKLANAIAGRLREEAIRDDEARLIFARDVAILTKHLDIHEMLNEEIEKLSDSDVDDELARDGE